MSRLCLQPLDMHRPTEEHSLRSCTCLTWTGIAGSVQYPLWGKRTRVSRDHERPMKWTRLLDSDSSKMQVSQSVARLVPKTCEYYRPSLPSCFVLRQIHCARFPASPCIHPCQPPRPHSGRCRLGLDVHDSVEQVISILHGTWVHHCRKRPGCRVGPARQRLSKTRPAMFDRVLSWRATTHAFGNDGKAAGEKDRDGRWSGVGAQEATPTAMTTPRRGNGRVLLAHPCPVAEYSHNAPYIPPAHFSSEQKCV